MTVEKNLSRRSRYDLVQLEGNSRSSTSLKKTEIGSINLWDKLQFVNSMKRLAFDSTKISFIKRLISISHLIVEVLNEQNLLQNRIWLIGCRVMLFKWSFLRTKWSYSVVWKKWITLTLFRPGFFWSQEPLKTTKRIETWRGDSLKFSFTKLEIFK